MKKIVFCGGGTAGHVYPALAIAEQLKNYEIHFVGSDGIEKEILKEYPNIKYHQISAVKLERKLTLKNLLIPIKLVRSIRQAKHVLKEVQPNVIFSKGGFVSVPVAIAGKLTKIPVISHESDLSFGLANKIILRFCTKMCTTFPETARGNVKCICTGQPIREKLFEGTPLRLNLDKTKENVLVLGGSLGAKFLNDLVFENLDELTKHFNIIHICGKKNYKKIAHSNYHLTPYAENIGDYFKTADMVISRAGSGVINELLALQKPMLLVPLSKKCSRGDQIENAKLFEQKGYAICVEEENCTIEKTIENLQKISKNKQNFIKNMKKTAKNNAISKITDILSSY